MEKKFSAGQCVKLIPSREPKDRKPSKMKVLRYIDGDLVEVEILDRHTKNEAYHEWELEKTLCP